MIIKIEGKKNIDCLKKLNNFDNELEERKVSEKWDNKDYILDPEKQISITNQLYLMKFSCEKKCYTRNKI